MIIQKKMNFINVLVLVAINVKIVKKVIIMDTMIINAIKLKIVYNQKMKIHALNANNTIA